MAADETMIEPIGSEPPAVAPAADAGTQFQHADVKDTTMQDVRDALDASDSEKLAKQPDNEDAKLDIALDETFPTSDAPSNTQPGKGMDPAPSSGFDEEAEKARMSGKE